MAENKQINKSLDLALRVGEVLLSSGAGAADVNATMWSVVHAAGLRDVDVDVTFTALTLTYRPASDEPPVLQVRNVRHREIDYEDLTLVDLLVRDLVAAEIDVDEARSRLARIVSSGHPLPRWAANLGYGTMGAGVGMLLGGNLLVIGIAFVAAVAVDLLQRAMSRRRLPGFYQQVAGGLLATMFAIAAAVADLGADPSMVVTASIFMLLAGIGFMGAVQDALTGFPLTAGARILEATLATAGIIAGVSGGLSIARLLEVDLGRLNPGVGGLAEAGAIAAGSAIAAAAFGSVHRRRGTGPRPRMGGGHGGGDDRRGLLRGRRPDPGATPGRRGPGDRPVATGPVHLPRVDPAGHGRQRHPVPDERRRHRDRAGCRRAARRALRPAAQARGPPARESSGRTTTRGAAPSAGGQHPHPGSGPTGRSSSRLIHDAPTRPSYGGRRAVIASTTRSQLVVASRTMSCG